MRTIPSCTADDQRPVQLHVLATDGPPMVHLTNCKKPRSCCLAPSKSCACPLRGGTCILVSAPAAATRCEFAASPWAGGPAEDRLEAFGRRDSRDHRSRRDLPRRRQFLMESNAQHNLAGRLEIDALPRPVDSTTAAASRRRQRGRAARTRRQLELRANCSRWKSRSHLQEERG